MKIQSYISRKASLLCHNFFEFTSAYHGTYVLIQFNRQNVIPMGHFARFHIFFNKTHLKLFFNKSCLISASLHFMKNDV